MPAGENGDGQETNGPSLPDDRLLNLKLKGERAVSPLREDVVAALRLNQFTPSREIVRGRDLGKRNDELMQGNIIPDRGRAFGQTIYLAGETHEFGVALGVAEASAAGLAAGSALSAGILSTS